MRVTYLGDVDDVQISKEQYRNAVIEYIKGLESSEYQSSTEFEYKFSVPGFDESISIAYITFKDTAYKIWETHKALGGGQGQQTIKVTYAYEKAASDGEYHTTQGANNIDSAELDSIIKNSGQNNSNSNINEDGLRISDDPSKVLYFTNYARMYQNVKDKDAYLSMSTAYLIIYIALITFTVVFTIRYIKRVIYIAFLTLMAPMVALTYPIDKIKDRKSASMGYVV